MVQWLGLRAFTAEGTGSQKQQGVAKKKPKVISMLHSHYSALLSHSLKPETYCLYLLAQLHTSLLSFNKYLSSTYFLPLCQALDMAVNK